MCARSSQNNRMKCNSKCARDPKGKSKCNSKCAWDINVRKILTKKIEWNVLLRALKILTEQRINCYPKPAGDPNETIG